jgi:Flp pilus assembly protein TadB
MASEPETREGGLPEPTEQVHLPEPSFLPVVTAFGVTLLLVGVVLTWILSIIGGIILIVAVVRWVRETRQEISELPLEHH